MSLQFLIEFAGITLAMLAALYGAGLFPSLLLPPRFRRHGVLIAPFLGFAVISGSSHYLGTAGFATRQFVWPVLIFFWILGLLLWWRRGRPRIAWRESFWPLVLVGAFYLMATSPLFLARHVTTIGWTIDAISHVCRAEVVENGPLAIPEVQAGRPCTAWAASPMRVKVRMGDVYFVAAIDALTGHRAYKTFNLVSALFFAFMTGGLYVLCRETLRLRPAAALIAMTLTGLSNLLLWAVYDNFLSQTVGASLVPAALSFTLESLRRRRVREGIFAGCLWSGLASAYSIYLLYVLTAAAAFAFYLWLWGGRSARRRALPGLVKTSLVIFFSMMVVNSVAFVRCSTGVWASYLGTELSSIRAGVSRAWSGNIITFPHPGEIIGLVNHPTAAYPNYSLGFPQLPRSWASLLFLMLVALGAYGWLRLPSRARPAAAAVVAVALALTMYMRFGLTGSEGHPYHYFKSLSLTSLAVLPLLGQSFFVLTKARHAQLRARWRRAAATGLVLLLGVNSLNTAFTIYYVWQKRIIVNKELVQITEGAALLPRSTPILVAVPQGQNQNWLGYLLEDYRIGYQPSLLLWPVVEHPFGAIVEYVLISHGTEEAAQVLPKLWSPAEGYTTLWSNGTYALLRRPPNAVRPPSVFSDGFESGDKKAWQLSR